LDVREFSYWMAYHEREPWGEKRADLRSGIVAATVANANRGKDTDPFSPGDFMPEFGKASKEQTAEEANLIVRQWATLFAERPIIEA
jgi:hypothetical protein